MASNVTLSRFEGGGIARSVGRLSDDCVRPFGECRCGCDRPNTCDGVGDAGADLRGAVIGVDRAIGFSRASERSQGNICDVITQDAIFRDEHYFFMRICALNNERG
jgi:hypothetical protein